jgi:hypothetical protein
VNPVDAFHGPDYLRINDARIKHADSLGLLQPGMTVLEVGAGVGDHTLYLLSKGCKVTATDARTENLIALESACPQARAMRLNLDAGPLPMSPRHDLVYCYGTLYHLCNPSAAIQFMAAQGRMLMLETCVSYGVDYNLVLGDEDPADPTQSFGGRGCRPTRTWVFVELCRNYQHVYSTLTQPSHKDFPTDWTQRTVDIPRAVFVASHEPLDNALLFHGLLDKQEAI